MKALRRTAAGLLALAGLWLALDPAVPAPGDRQEAPVPRWQRVLLGESPVVAQWMADRDRRPAETEGAPSAEEPPAPEEPAAQPPAQEPAQNAGPIRERSITGGAGYLTGGGVSVFNRTEKTVDLEGAAQAGTSLRLAPADRGPQILIMHTHTTESYARDPDAPYTETGTAHTMDTGYNIVQVGDAMTQVLTEMGFSVLHDTQVYDWPSYNGAYERSRAGVEAILAQYPTVQILDVHRDAPWWTGRVSRVPSVSPGRLERRPPR